MNALIIGCGYLGRRAAAAWRARGHAVAALTRSAHRADELRAAGIEPILGDVTDRASLRGLPPADIVLHAVGFDRASGHSQRAVFVDGLENVLREIRNRAGALVHVSSTSVYGQSEGEWVDEASPCAPHRDNGRVCLEAESTFWNESTGDARGAARCNVLRLAGIYGPGRLLRRVELLRSAEPIGGNPDAWLNLIHVDDAVQAVLACAERGRSGATYLVCDDRPVRRREYFESLARLTGAPPPTFALDPADPEAAGINKRCSNRRLRDELEVRLVHPTIDSGLPASLEVSTASPADPAR